MHFPLSVLILALAFASSCPPSTKDPVVVLVEPSSLSAVPWRDAAYAAAVDEMGRLERLLKQQPRNRSAVKRMAETIQLLVQEVAEPREPVTEQEDSKPAKQPGRATAGAPSGPVTPSSEPSPAALIERQRKYLEQTHRPLPIGKQGDRKVEIVSLAHIPQDELSKRAQTAINSAKHLRTVAEDSSASLETIRAETFKLRQHIDQIGAPITKSS